MRGRAAPQRPPPKGKGLAAKAGCVVRGGPARTAGAPFGSSVRCPSTSVRTCRQQHIGTEDGAVLRFCTETTGPGLPDPVAASFHCFKTALCTQGVSTSSWNFKPWTDGPGDAVRLPHHHTHKPQSPLSFNLGG